jgi:hypothetical protein
MTTVTFDKLAYIDRLKAAHFNEDQARALAESLDVALREEIVTKSELKAQLADLKSDFKAELAVTKWMSGSALAILIAIAIKTFLH